ncbi:hypothetical protein E1160_01950 [Rhodospirillaceae bacterium RKSG073]|nr:hypothetical protein [Curvivirga aplysinae]
MNEVVSDIGAQLNQFFSYDLPHKVVRIAKSDHVIWKKRLADMLAGKESLRAGELASHRECRLGKFYYGPDAAMYRKSPDFAKLEAPHVEVHKWGIEAVKRYNNSDVAGALEAVEKVEEASKDVIRLLDNLAKTPLKFEDTPSF